MPAISVVMAVYNGEKYLKEAVDSILNQTFTDFEFIIIDDGSTDKTLKILQTYSDQRIIIVSNERNLGISHSRNIGLKRARGQYIAHMDADDISVPGRIEKQYRFMEKNPEVGLCGSAREVFGNKSKLTIPFLNHEEIFTRLLFSCSIFQPSSFQRKAINNSGIFFDTNYKYAEDTEYFIRLGLNGVRFANLKEPLLKYRRHQDNVSVAHKGRQQKDAARARLHLFKALKIKNPESKHATHIQLRYNNNLLKQDIIEISDWINELIRANNKEQLFCTQILKKELSRRWFKVCYKSSNHGLWALRAYYKQPVYNYYKVGIWLKFKFLAKCILPGRLNFGGR